MLKAVSAVLGGFLVAATLAWAPPARAAEPMPSCASSPKLVGQCFTVRGRLLACNGFPGVTIWIVGTKRIVGVVDPMGEVSLNSLPPGRLHDEMLAVAPCNKAAFGDYTLCPLEPDKPGVMRLVCLDKAARLRFAEDW